MMLNVEFMKLNVQQAEISSYLLTLSGPHSEKQKKRAPAANGSHRVDVVFFWRVNLFVGKS